MHSFNSKLLFTLVAAFSQLETFLCLPNVRNSPSPSHRSMSTHPVIATGRSFDAHIKTPPPKDYSTEEEETEDSISLDGLMGDEFNGTISLDSLIALSCQIKGFGKSATHTLKEPHEHDPDGKLHSTPPKHVHHPEKTEHGKDPEPPVGVPPEKKPTIAKETGTGLSPQRFVDVPPEKKPKIAIETGTGFQQRFVDVPPEDHPAPIENGNGQIMVDVPIPPEEGHPVQIENGNGQIMVDVPIPPEEDHSVQIENGNGQIMVDVPIPPEGHGNLGPMHNDGIEGTHEGIFSANSDGEQMMHQYQGNHPFIVRTDVVSIDGDDAEFCSKPQLGPLVKFFKGSKYFADKRGLYTYEKAKEMCKRYKLVVGELEDVADHRSVQTYVTNAIYHPDKGKAGYQFDKFYIGTNDIADEGLFKRANQRTNITFQNFHRSQPDDKNQNEDCVVLHQELTSGPVGSSDVSCDSSAHVICMYPIGSECYMDTNETHANEKALKERGLEVVSNMANKYIYYVSNFQATWKNALKNCTEQKMKLFILDHIVGPIFFRQLLKWQKNFVDVPIPTVEFWTAGKFESNHMDAPIFWHTESEYGHVKHPEHHNQSFSFSGVFRWSEKKGGDPGAAYGTRRDLCVSFGFEGVGDSTPLIRNTNCDIPCYFVCVKEQQDTTDY